MRTGAKIVAWWIALVLVSAVMANLIVLFLDGTARKKYEMGAHSVTQENGQLVARLDERVAFLERTAVLQPTEEYNPQLLKTMEPYETSNKAPTKEEVRDAWVNRVWLANTPNQIRSYTCPTDALNRQPRNAMQAKDRVIACAMRIHTMEQEQDMLRLRVEELEERHEALEEMVYGFHPTNKTVKDASQWTCVYHNWTGDEDD